MERNAVLTRSEGMLEGNTFSEDGAIRRQAAKEFSGGKQELLFAKKLQGKVSTFSISQIRDGRITLAAVSREEYNILARCREFFQDTDVRVSKPRRPGGHLRRAALPAFLRRAVRLFGGRPRTCTRCFHPQRAVPQHLQFRRGPCCRGRVSLEEQKRADGQTALPGRLRSGSWSASTRAPALLVGSGHPGPLPAGVRRGGGQGTAGGAAPLAALYQNGRIHSQRATWKAYDYDRPGWTG